MRVMYIFFMAHYDVSFSGAGNGDFVAVFVAFMILAFGNKVHRGFVQRVNLVFIFGLQF